MKRKSEFGISHLRPKKMKISDNEKTVMEFDDMCDNVIDIILYNLELEDLANISDTNSRLRNMAASIFSRKYGNRLVSFDVFHHYDMDDFSLKIHMCLVTVSQRHKQIIRVSKSNIWFKLLRNFGEFMKFIRIQDIDSIEPKIKIPNVLENLFQYVLKYCTDSLEILELHSCPFFIFNKPLNKLHEFHFLEAIEPRSITLNLMPNIRSLNIHYLPKTLVKHFPKLERITLFLAHDEESLCSFISFLRLNRQITYLRFIGMNPDHRDRVYSSIEEYLTKLKILKMPRGTLKRNAMEPIPTYRLKTIEKFSFWCLNRKFNEYSFEFKELKKIRIHANLSLECIKFLVLNIRKIKTLKIFLNHKYYYDRDAIVKELTQLTELEYIITRSRRMEYILTLKTALGNEWKQIEVKEEKVDFTRSLFKSKFQRISKKVNTN